MLRWWATLGMLKILRVISLRLQDSARRCVSANVLRGRFFHRRRNSGGAQRDGVEKRDDQQVRASLSYIGPGGSRMPAASFGFGYEMTGIAPGNYILTANLISSKGPLSLGSQALHLSSYTTVHFGETAKTSVGGRVISSTGIPPGLRIVAQDLATSEGTVTSVNPMDRFSSRLSPLAAIRSF